MLGSEYDEIIELYLDATREVRDYVLRILRQQERPDEELDQHSYII